MDDSKEIREFTNFILDREEMRSELKSVSLTAELVSIFVPQIAVIDAALIKGMWMYRQWLISQGVQGIEEVENRVKSI